MSKRTNHPILSEIQFEDIYASGEVSPDEFFFSALSNSKNFDLALGFFKSSGFNALAFGFTKFILNNGKMRFLINEELTEKDLKTIEKGIDSDPVDIIEERVVQNFSLLLNTLSKPDEHFFKCLSWLIATNKLEIKIALASAPDPGLVHHKYGIFSDLEGNKLSFVGSTNFSWSAFKKNIETVETNRSWTREIGQINKVKYYSRLFDKAWNDESEVIKTIDANRLISAIKSSFQIESLDELTEIEKGLIKYNSRIRKHIFNEKPDGPKLPEDIDLYDYQKTAYLNWRDSGYKGLFEMATGTGKTITALNCALELYNKEDSLTMLVLVPTLTLASQWKDELESFEFKNITFANSENPQWANDLLRFVNISFHKEKSISIIATYAAYANPKFQSIVKKLPDSALIIADEVHNFGTTQQIEKYPHHFNRRIGLTATPQRYFDDEGSESIVKFFNAVEGPTISLDIKKAIELGFLSQYKYYPKIVRLSSDEMEMYSSISKKLVWLYNKKNPTSSEKEEIKRLLLQRKRIIHKAENKFSAFREILDLIKAEESILKYILVYVPEGSSEPTDLEESEKLINSYSQIISDEYSLSQHQYIGTTKDRERVLKEFSEGKISVLTAMKCLDEGVDVKRTETAIFCSSTGNPKQFIQRRGRILRKHPDKDYAKIYDLVVVPMVKDDNSKRLEKNLFLSEFRRIKEFAVSAVNHFQALDSLKYVAEELGIEIFIE